MFHFQNRHHTRTWRECLSTVGCRLPFPAVLLTATCGYSVQKTFSIRPAPQSCGVHLIQVSAQTMVIILIFYTEHTFTHVYTSSPNRMQVSCVPGRSIDHQTSGISIRIQQQHLQQQQQQQQQTNKQKAKISTHMDLTQIFFLFHLQIQHHTRSSRQCLSMDLSLKSLHVPLSDPTPYTHL